VPAKEVKQFLARHPEIKQLNLKDAGHYRIIRDKEAIKEIIDFLNN
jgi:hypothetical protein